ncbi:MAG: PadR family transcriptional regulator [Acidobacteriota bacterium]
MSDSAREPAALPLSEPMFLILLVLEESHLHGYAIRQQIAARTNDEHVLRTGTLYNALSRLSRDGLVAEVSRESAGRGKREYRLTREGRTALDVETQRLQRLADLATQRPLQNKPESAS